MDFKYKQLEQELSALSKMFGELGARLSEVAKEVTTPGVNPPEKLIEQISAARSNFESVRAAVHGHAGSMLVAPLPKLVEMASIAAVDNLLKLAAAAEEVKFSTDGERERALGILSRVLAITHREAGDFKPLQECHATIGELRSAIGKVMWPNRHPESESIIAMKHPATALLTFVENVDTLDDDRWMSLENTITQSFGKPLFVAASRGKLVAASAGPQAEPAPTAAKPAPPVEKPVEKKTVVEKAPEKMEVPAVAAVVVEKKPAPVAAPPVEKPPVEKPSVEKPSVEKKEAVQEKAPQKPAAPVPVATPVAPIAPPVVAPLPAAPVVVAQIPAAAATVPAAPVAAPVSAPAPAPSVAAAPVVAPAPRPPAPPAPAPVSAPPVAAAQSAPAPQASTITSLSALATATEPATERRAASTPPPADHADKQRKEPRLATPAAQQPIAKSEAKPQDPSLSPDDPQRVMAADGSQRPQRWGFWRGNR